ELPGNNSYVPVDADHPNVVGDGSNRARDVRSMRIPARGKDVVVVTETIPPTDIIHISISVVVNPVNWVVRVGPNVGCQIRMRVLNAFVNDTHDDRTRPGISSGPSFRGLAAVLVGRDSQIAVHSPETAVH